MLIMHVETGRHLYGGARQVCYLVEGLAAEGFEKTLDCFVILVNTRAAVRDGRVLARDAMRRHFREKGGDSGAQMATHRAGSGRMAASIRPNDLRAI